MYVYTYMQRAKGKYKLAGQSRPPQIGLGGPSNTVHLMVFATYRPSQTLQKNTISVHINKYIFRTFFFRANSQFGPYYYNKLDLFRRPKR